MKIQLHRRHVLSHTWDAVYERDNDLVLLCIILPAYDIWISSICPGSPRWACMINSPSHQSLLGLSSNGCSLFLILWLVSLQSLKGLFLQCTGPVTLSSPYHLGDLTERGTAGLTSMEGLWKLLRECVLVWCVCLLLTFSSMYRI